MVSQTTKGRQLLSQKRDEWVASGRAVEELQACREAKIFWDNTVWIDVEKRRLDQDIKNWVTVKALAKQHHDGQQQRLQAGLRVGPSFASYLEKNQPQAFARISGDEFSDDLLDMDSMTNMTDMMSRSADLHASQHWTVASTPQSAVALPQPKAPSSHHGLGVLRDASRLVVHHGSQSLTPQSQNPVRFREHATNAPAADGLQAQRMAVQSQVQAQQQSLRAAAQYAIPEVQEHQKKRGRPYKKQKAEASPSPEKSSSRIRRSSRVKDKPINYAVDTLSEVSRSPSPAKSDVSAFSPERSDHAYTPVKPRATVKKETSTLHDSLLGRGKVNLADQIGEWSRSDSGVSTPSRDLEQHPESRKRKTKQAAIDESDNIVVKQEPAQKQVWGVNPHADQPYGSPQPPTGEQQPVWMKQADGSSRLSPHVKSEPSSQILPFSAPTPRYSQYRQDGNAFPAATSVGAYAMTNPFKNSTMSQLHHGNHRVAPPSQETAFSTGYLVTSTNGQLHQEFENFCEDIPVSGKVWPTDDGSAVSPPTGSDMR